MLLGNVDGPTLAERSAGDIAEQCRAILTDRRDDRAFILATSAADVPLETPPESIDALMEAPRAGL